MTIRSLFLGAVLLVTTVLGTTAWGQTTDIEPLQKEINALYQEGKYLEASVIAERLLLLQETALGPDHPHVATALNNLAGLYQSQGRYADAEPLYKRSLGIVENTLGTDNPGDAKPLNNLDKR